MRSWKGLATFAILAMLGSGPLQAQAIPGAVSAPQERLLVLPVRFAYFKYGAAQFVQFIPEKSEAAVRNLEGSLTRARKRAQNRQYVELPELSDEEQAILHEHADLLWLAAAGAASHLAQRTPAPWRTESPWRFDYSIGKGLAFLADRAGVDRAIFVSGARAEPSGSVAIGKMLQIVLLQSFLVGAGNRKELSAIVVDLRSGDVLSAYLPERGFAGEADEVAGANTWVRALFDVIPEPPLGELKRDRPPPPEKTVRHPRPRRGFNVMRPAGWNTSDSMHLLCFRRHASALESICIDDKSLDDALRAGNHTTEVDPMTLGDIAVGVLKADPSFADMEIRSLAPATIAGRAGFRAELSSRLNFGNSRLRERHVVYGVTSAQGAYLVRFDAPAIYYFDRHLPEFEALLPTFKLL